MRVFLSSTSRDLKDHREAAFHAIQGMDYHCVQMEHFNGPAVPIKEFDDKKIVECDLFVLLLGQLYGTCPSDSEKSYTELEYETAVRLGKQIVVFLSEENYPLTTVREPDAKHERLRAFRGKFTGLIRNSFTTPESLAAKIPLALHVLKPAATAPTSARPTPPDPYFVHPYALQANFTGRENERRMLTDWWKSGPNVLSIEAIGGMGKSALTWVWVNQDVLSSGAPEGIVWWSFYEREATFAAFVKETLLYVSGGQSFDDPLRALLYFLAQKRLLLVLDGFERELRAYAGLNAAYQGDESPSDAEARTCIDPHAAFFLQWVASAPLRSHVLLTTRLHARELDGLVGCRQIALRAMDPDDAVSFFQSQGIKGTRAEIQAACAPYGYHPLALRLLAGVIVKDHRYPKDIKAAGRYPIAKELLGKEKHHILQVAYGQLDKGKRDLLHLMAAFRSPISHEALVALIPFKTERDLDAGLDDLIERGLLFRGETHYDLHPVVRQHAYDRLTNKPGVHIRLRDYFAKAPRPDQKKVESIDDLILVIELYHHTIRAGQYDEALELYRDRLSSALYYRFGAYQLCIDLLRGLFPDGEELAPRLKSERAQAWTLNELAISYTRSGQPGQAVRLGLAANLIWEKEGDKVSLAIGSRVLANAQIQLGQLRDTEQALRKSLDLAREQNADFQLAMAHQELGRLHTYQGLFGPSLSDLDSALAFLREQGYQQGEGFASSYKAIRALLMNNSFEGLGFARRARELAAVEGYERDVICAEWLLGWSQLDEAHLTEALTRCRRINAVELEPDILLAFARLHRKRDERDTAIKYAHEALALADRCEYRLVQADCHNLLADLTRDISHAHKARERALCDDPEYCYKPALDEADRLIAELEGRPGRL